MPLAHCLRSLVLVAVLPMVAVPGCSREIADETWMVDVFTREREVGSYDHDSAIYYEFRDDHTVVTSSASECSRLAMPTLERPWEHRGGDEIVVLPLEGDREVFEGSGNAEWRVRQGSDCNELQLYPVRIDGVEEAPAILNRGRICLELEREPPPFEDVTSCRTVWCDEPPPPCP